MAYTNGSGRFKAVSRFLTLLFAVLVALGLTTCDLFKVGLGKKVDINAPSITLTSHESGAYVKGPITLSGDCSDDIGVNAVTVTAAGVETPFTADASAGTSWTLVLDTTVLKDSRTSFTATATDASGKSGSFEFLLFVDNTAPTVMITSPLIYGPPDYPQQSDYLEVKGEVYDVSPITKVHVTIRSAAGTVLKEADADGSNTWTCRFNLKNTAGFASAAANGTYYYSVQATDKGGNVSSYYYHRKDVRAFASLAGKTFPAMDEIGEIDQAGSGTAPSGFTFGELSAARLAMGDSPVYANFSFSYESLPDISFTNLNRAATDPSANELAVDAPITGLVVPPPNGGSVDASTLYAYIYGSEAEYLASAPPILTLHETTSDDSDYVLTKAVGDSVSFVLTLKYLADPDGAGPLAAGDSLIPDPEYYMIVTADAEGSHGHQDVRFSISSAAPILTETGIGSSTQSKNAAFNLSGTAISSLDLSGGFVDVEQSYNNPSGPFTLVASGAHTLTLGAGTNVAWTTDDLAIKLPRDPGDIDAAAATNGSDDGLYYYRVTLTTPAGKKTSLERSVMYDTTGPTIVVNSMNPEPASGTNKVNGVVAFSVGITDLNGIGEARWGVAATEPTWAALAANVLPSPYAGSVNTDSYPAGATKLWFLARDKAGNQGPAVSRDIDIDPATDAPSIELTNMNVAFNTAPQASGNLQGTGAKVTGTLTDDDMIDSSTLQISVDAPATFVDAFGSAPADGKSVSFSHTFTGLTQGVHYYYLRVSDLASAKSGRPFATTAIGPVYFAYDTANPVLTETVVGGETIQYRNANLNFQGQASDTNAFSSLTYTVNGILPANIISIDADGPDNVAGNGDDNAWSCLVDAASLSDGSYQYVFTATDAASRTTVLTRNVMVDKTLPAISLTAISGYQSSIVPISGTASDSGSGLVRVEYQLGAGAWTTASGFDPWVGSLDVSGAAEGDITLSARSVDRAGNTSAPLATRTVQVDRANPRATETLHTSALIQTTGTVNFAGIADDAAVTALRAASSAVITWSKDGVAQAPVPLAPAADGSWSWDLLASNGDGLYVITLTVTDVAGKVSTVTRSAQIDATAPILAITAPSASEAVSSPTYTFTGMSRDTGGVGFDGTDDVEFRLNAGAWTAVTLTGSTWSTGSAVALGSQGAKTLDVRSTDRLGNQSTASVVFYYDLAPPTLTETLVNTTSTQYRNANLSLGGIATDSNALSGLTVSVDGGAASSVTVDFDGPDNVLGNADDGPWTYTVDVDTDGVGVDTGLAEGTHTLAFTATDIASKTTSLTRSVLVDTTVPTAGITAVSGYQSGTIPISGIAGDTGSGVASVQFQLGGTAGAWTAASGTNAWGGSLNLASSAEGDITLYARSTDMAGNTSANATTVIQIDRALPRATEVNHASALIQTATDVVFLGMADDASVTAGRAATSAVISWTKDGVAQVDEPLAPVLDADGPDNIPGNADDGFYWTWTLAASNGDGLYALTLTVTDVAGKVSTVTRTAQIDTAAPTLVVSAPTASELVVTGTYTFSGTSRDSGGVGFDGTDDVEYSLDGGTNWTAVTLSGTNWSAAGVSLGSEGTKTVRIRSTDRIGNSTFQDVIFYFDASAPSLDETAIGTASEQLRNTDVTLAGTASDTNSLTSVTISATKNGVSQGDVHTTGASPWSYTMSVAGGTNDGLWSFTITARDAANRTTVLSRNVRVDTQAPSVTISLPVGGSYVTGSTYTASGGASDNGTLSLVQYSLDNSNWYGATGLNSWTVSLNLATIGEGSRTLYMRARDAATNTSATESVNFFVDLNPPSLTETSVGSGTVYRNGLFTLSGNVGDGVDLASLAVTQNKDGGGASTVYSTTYPGASDTSSAWSVGSLPSGGASAGVYEFIITVTDSSGKSSQLTRTVTVDTIPPTVEITSVLPILAGAVVNGRVTLSATANDASGLTGVKYFARQVAGVPAYADGDGTTISAPYSATINTGGYTDSAPLYLYVVARDKAGNDASFLATVNVSQASDIPSAGIESPIDGDAIGADKKIRGTFSDDDGVASGGAVLYVKKSSDSTWTSKAIATASSAGQLVAWTVDVADVLTAGGDGAYDIYLHVADDATKKSGLASVFVEVASAASPRHFSYDNSPPTVSANLTAAPSQTAYKIGDAVTISWTATDASGLASQVFDMDGVSTGLGTLQNPSGSNYNVTYTVPVAAASGNKTFTLVVTDNTGRSTTRTMTILVDVDNPTVEAAMTLEPAFVGFTPNGAFTVKGTASDNRSLASVQVQLTGPSGSLAWTNATLVNGVWSYAIANSAAYVAASGTLQVEVRAFDGAGNVSATQTFNQAVDQSADLPTVSILSPVAATYGTTVQVSGTAADDDNLADIDNNSVIDANAITIEYEGLVPAVAVQSVNPTSITGSGKNATFNHSLTLDGGTWRVRARSMDDNSTNGNWTGWVNFTVDTGAPALSVDANAAFTTTFTTGSTLNITGTANDSGGLKFVHARVNGGSWVLASAAGMVDVAPADGVWDTLATGVVTWSINLGLGSDGLKTIEIAASDNVDIVSTVQRSTTLDSTLPTGAFDATFKDHPTGSSLSLTALNKVVRVTGTVTELNLRDADPVEISIDGGTFLSVTGTFVWSYVWDTTALSGAHSLTLRVTDKAGNLVDSIVANVTVDQSADTPIITQAFAPAGSSALAGNNVLGTVQKVSGTLSDDDGFNVGSVNLYVDGSPTPIGATNTAGTTATWEYTFSGGSILAQGEHYYSIQATDRNSLAQSLGPTYFLVDTANPLVDFTAPASGAKVRAGTLTISGTASDLGGFGAAPVALTLRHSNTLSALHNLSFSLPVSAGAWSQDVAIDGASLDGTLYLDVIATDRAGKTSSTTRSITIDTTSPSLTLTYPSAGAYINGLVSITGTADDLNGLSALTLEILDPAAPHNLPRASISRTSSGMSAWEFAFNSNLYTSSTYGFDVNSDGKLWQVWFRLAATDTSGNVTYYQPSGDWPYLYIDTDGDKPTISVTQPKNGETLGGFVTMFGTATDDDGPVMQVEVRINFNGDGDFTDTRDINNNDGDSNPATGIELGADQNILGNIVRIGNATYKWEDEAAWYVVPVTNNAWTLELNTNGELYKSNTGGVTGDIVIQTRSRDVNGLASEISSRTIRLDETYPRIENIDPADQTYQSGTINLTAEFRDNAEIPLGTPTNANMRVVINKTTTVHLTEGINVPGTHPYSLLAVGGNPANGYDLVYPINTSAIYPGSSGVLYVDLYVKDAVPYTNQKSFTYYVDNQPPTSSWSDSSTRPDGSELRNGMVTVNGAGRTYVEGNYGDSGAVSGISRVEMYLVKSGSVRNLKASGTWSGTPATETTSYVPYNPVTNTYGTETSGSLAFISHDALDIRTAGTFTVGNKYTIVSIGDTDFTAIGATTNTVGATFTATGAGAGTGTANDNTVADRYVAKIDKASEMSSFNLGTDIDADGYYEYMGIYEGAPRWRAYFDSQYLPDGLADLHYVVYDLAGNRIHKMRQVFIANNGPVVDQIQIGSDLNSNATVANVPNVNEITDYYNTSLSVNRSDSQKIKNGRIFLSVAGHDPNGNVKQIFVDVYSGSTYLGNAFTSSLNPSGGTESTTRTISVGTSPWLGSYAGGKVDYTLKVTVRDNDDINVTRWAYVSVMDPADVTPPVITLNSLAQADQDKALGHLELQDANPAWTAIRGAYGSDDDPKASGTLVIKGTLFDENRLSLASGTAENIPDGSLAAWSGGILASDAAAFTIDSQTLGEAGHTVNFTYKWDTSKVASAAGLDKVISFGAQDASANTADAKTKQVDVVPYITGIVRSEGAEATYRSKYGRFSIREGETGLTILGFNLTASSTAAIYQNASGGTASCSLSGIALASGGITADMPAASYSGYLRAFTNTYMSVNNINSNTLSYNQEIQTGVAKTALWSDDRYFDLFRTGDSFNNSANPVYPAMTMDGSYNLLGSWTNYGQSGTYIGTTSGNTQIFTQYDPPEYTDTVHSSGAQRTVVLENYVGGTTSNDWGALAIFSGNTEVQRIEELGDDTIATRNVSDGVDETLYQFQNPRIAYSAATGMNYVSYYDYFSKCLKYAAYNSYFAMSGNVNNNTPQTSAMNVTAGTTYYMYLYDWASGGGTGNVTINVTGTQSGTVYIATSSNASARSFTAAGIDTTVTVTIVRESNDNGSYRVNGTLSTAASLYAGGGHQTDSASVVDGTDNFNLSIDTTSNIGEWSSIDTVSGVPVIAYYDSYNKKLRWARGNSAVPSGTANWYKGDVTAANTYIGKYVSMKIDGSGGMHIAAYRENNGDLIYIYGTWNSGSNSYSFSTPVVIDSEGAVGSWCDIALNSTTPYISYADGSGVDTYYGLKMAYFDPNNKDWDGTTAKPDWEHVTVPASSSVDSARTGIEYRGGTGAGSWKAAMAYSSSTFDIVYFIGDQ